MKKIIILISVLILCMPSFTIYAQEKVDTCGLPQVLKRMHFKIYHDDNSFANNISWKAEYCYKKIVRHFNVSGFHPWEKNKKCSIYVFENKKDFIAGANAPNWSCGLARHNPPRLYIYKGSKDLIKNTLPHEITHLIFSEFMDKNKIPIWLNEGMAQYEEKEWDGGYAKKYLKSSLKKGIYIKLEKLFNMKNYPSSGEKRRLFYLQSASIIDYLRKEQIASLYGKFLMKIKHGKSLETALKETYMWKFKGGIPDLEEKWVKFIKSKY